MTRKIRARLTFVVMAGLLAFAFMGPIGCSGGTGPTKCTSNADCDTASGQTCDTASGQCKSSSTTGCTSAADCGTGKVCDGGKCYDDCTADGFAGCDPGNACDSTAKRCTCDATACAGVGNSGCHPKTNTCDNYCNPASTSDCTDPEKCLATTADPTKGFCQTPTSCTDNSACATGQTCDTAKGYCVPAGSSKCTADADCAGNAAGTKCNTTSGACVACLADGDCNAASNETCDTATNTCKGPSGCQDSKTCYDTTAKTYCGTKGSACEAAPAATCSNMVSAEEAKTSSWASNDKGMVIWGIKEVERKTTNNCVSGGSGDSCSSDADCSGGEVCAAFDSKCHALQSNGEVIIEFNFYSPVGIKSGIIKGTDGGTTNFESGTDRKAGDGWGDLATKLEISSGTANEGVARFSVCSSQDYKSWFAFTDTDAKISNAACVDISPRQ